MKFFSYNLTLDIDGLQMVDPGRERPWVVDCLNPHSFVTAEEDAAFKQALTDCDILLPDGVGICMEVHHWKGRQIKKIAGDDFHRHVLGELEAMGGRIYYMGSTEEVLDKIKARLALEYPHIECRTYSPTFCKKLSEEECQRICADVESFKPHALMVGMTAPKQEKWIHENVHRLPSVKVIGAIGGAFEFYAGTIRRAPQWAINHHMEWLWRFVKEPRRMWDRNVKSTPKFLLYTRKHHEEM